MGNGLDKNEDALKSGKTGTVFVQEWKDMCLESQVGGIVDLNFDCPLIDKKADKFTSANGKMALAATYEAINEARLSVDDLRGKRVAVILGCGGSSFQTVFDGAQVMLETRRVKRVSPFSVTKIMNSSAAANIALALGVTGESYAISSACTSGSHSIIIATRLIRDGSYDMVITGGSEETSWVNALGFDAMKALSRTYNDSPWRASRPFDRNRSGFILAEGAGILVLENLEHARKRGAEFSTVVSGMAANSNASDMVVPDSQSAADLMRMAIQDAGISLEDIDYINAHGTATNIGDPKELEAVKLLFADKASGVPVSSTKSMTGHMIGATGAVEAIFCSQMIEKGFIAPTMNMENVEPGFEWADLVPNKARTGVTLRHVLNNSFGFGGTNGALIISAAEARS